MANPLLNRFKPETIDLDLAEEYLKRAAQCISIGRRDLFAQSMEMVKRIHRQVELRAMEAGSEAKTAGDMGRFDDE